jgi:hypothetical protein
MVTSAVFKSEFEETQARSKSMLDALQLCMQGAQLKIQQSGSSGSNESCSPEYLQTVMTQTKQCAAESMAIAVTTDAKLDAVLGNQQIMIQKQEEQLTKQSTTNSKVNILMDMVAHIDPNAAVEEAEIVFKSEISLSPADGEKWFYLVLTSSTQWAVQRKIHNSGALSEQEYVIFQNAIGTQLFTYKNSTDLLSGSICRPVREQVFDKNSTDQFVTDLTLRLQRVVESAMKALDFEERGLKLELSVLELQNRPGTPVPGHLTIKDRYEIKSTGAGHHHDGISIKVTFPVAGAHRDATAENIAAMLQLTRSLVAEHTAVVLGGACAVQWGVSSTKRLRFSAHAPPHRQTQYRHRT